MKTDTNWFGVRLLFESLHPEEKGMERTFEDRIILVKASTEGEAQEKAENFGKQAKEEYRNVYDKKVVWVFKEVMDVAPLYWEEVIGDGSEVYYAFLDEKALKKLRESLRPFEREAKSSPKARSRG